MNTSKILDYARECTVGIDQCFFRIPTLTIWIFCWIALFRFKRTFDGALNFPSASCTVEACISAIKKMRPRCRQCLDWFHKKGAFFKRAAATRHIAIFGDTAIIDPPTVSNGGVTLHLECSILYNSVNPEEPRFPSDKFTAEMLSCWINFARWNC